MSDSVTGQAANVRREDHPMLEALGGWLVVGIIVLEVATLVYCR